MAKWAWNRFKADSGDYRPVEFPPPGPYWCTGFGDGYSVVIAYIPGDSPEGTLRKYWPEAYDIETEDRESIVYSTRFPRPNWWKGE